jgi:predicted O-linked N-acetylglucosamine transferase (SPINDLY family)
MSNSELFDQALRLEREGDYARACSLFDRILEQDKLHMGAWRHRGSCLRAQGRPLDAANCLRQALDIDPGCGENWLHLGRALRDLQRIDDAIAAWRRALDNGADSSECLLSIAVILAQTGKRQASLDTLSELGLAPGMPFAVLYRAGLVFQRLGAWVDAVECFEQALAADPVQVDALLRLGACRSLTGQAVAAIADYRRLLKIAPHHERAHSNLLIQLHFENRLSPRDLFAEHKAWSIHCDEMRHQDTSEFSNARKSAKKLTVGWVSPRFDEGPVLRFLLSTLQALRGGDFDFIFYCNRKARARVSPEIRKLGRCHMIGNVDDAGLVRLVATDRVDILFDLTGHNPGNRLKAFARRLAPVQISWLDYFDTTGIPRMDYWLTDPHLTPQDSPQKFTEELLYFPSTRLCYSAPPFDISSSRSDRPKGVIRFGSFNRLSKLTDQVVSTWAGIVNRIEGSELVLKAGDFQDRRVVAHTLDRFAQAGLERRRIDLRERSPLPAMLDEYRDIDIALDPFPFTGCATSCDALWMGVPVISLRGDTLVSRQGQSILHNLGCPQWSTQDQQEYANVAASLAQSIRDGAHDRAELRRRMLASPLCDAAGQARALEGLLRDCWARYCELA